MDIVFFQTESMKNALGGREGALRRYRAQLRALSALPDLETTTVVGLEEDFLTLKIGLEGIARAASNSGCDPLPDVGGPILIIEDPNVYLPFNFANRLRLLGEQQAGRKVLKGIARNVCYGLRCNCRLFSRELSAVIRKQGRTLQDLKGRPWTSEMMVFEEEISTKRDEEQKVFELRLASCDFPEQLAIEPTNSCNLACTMCPYHSELYRNPRIPPYVPESEFRNIEPDLFKRLVDEAAAENIKTLIPQYRGEPFRHPQFLDLLEYAIGKGVHIAFPTNAMLIDEETAKRLVDIGLPQLQFSVDALDPDLYHKIRQNSDVKKVTQTIERIRQYRDQQGKTIPRLGMTFVELPLNRHEREAYVRHYLNIADFVRVCVGLSYQELHTRLPFEYFACEEEDRPPCRLLLDQVMITSDGKAVLCHTDSTQSYIIGDLNSHTIREIFTGERAQAIREAHRQRKFDALGLCQKCQIWKADISYPLPSFNEGLADVYGGPMGLTFIRKKPNEGPALPPPPENVTDTPDRGNSSWLRRMHKIFRKFQARP